MFLHKLDSVINKQVINNNRFGLQNDDINTKDDITRFDGIFDFMSNFRTFDYPRWVFIKSLHFTNPAFEWYQ
jgi:hypothetical protein